MFKIEKVQTSEQNFFNFLIVGKIRSPPKSFITSTTGQKFSLYVYPFSFLSFYIHSQFKSFISLLSLFLLLCLRLCDTHWAIFERHFGKFSYKSSPNIRWVWVIFEKCHNFCKTAVCILGNFCEKLGFFKFHYLVTLVFAFPTFDAAFIFCAEKLLSVSMIERFYEISFTNLT